MTAAPAEKTSTSVSDVEDQLAALITKLRDNIKESAAYVSADLTPFGYKVLWQLRKNGSLSPGVLAGLLGVDRSIISRQVRQLEQLGLVHVRPDAVDRRARVLELSPRAEGALAETAATGRSVLRRSLEKWQPEDLREFARLLEKLITTGD